MLKKVLFVVISIFPITSTIFANINHTVEFYSSDISFSTREEYDIISLEKCGLMEENFGKPMLPVKFVQLIIPRQHTVSDINFTSLVYDTLSGNYIIYPIQLPVIDSDEAISYEWTEPDSFTYNSNEHWPGILAKVMHEGYLGANKIVTLAIYPFTIYSC